MRSPSTPPESSSVWTEYIWWPRSTFEVQIAAAAAKLEAGDATVALSVLFLGERPNAKTVLSD